MIIGRRSAVWRPWRLTGIGLRRQFVTFAFSLALLFSLKVTIPSEISRDGDMRALTEGIRYAFSRPDLLGTYIVDLLAMALAYPVVMLPFVAAHFHTVYALSVLYCALPAARSWQR